MNIFRKRKTEEINLEIKETKAKPVDKDIEMYSEKQNFDEDNFDENMDFTAKNNLLLDVSDNLQKQNYSLINVYYICKIYSRIAAKDRKYNQTMLAIDKHINRIRKDFDSFNKQIKNINEQNIDNIYIKANDLLAFHQEIYNNLENIRKQYFYHLKIATVNVCINKTNQQLELMFKNLITFLNDYKNLNEAAEFIFYNSGQIITSTINSLLKSLKNKNYDFNYFLPSDVVITLSLKEWIELYNKIKFVIKNSQVELTNDYINYYQQFEIRYLILMMNMEASKDSKIASYNI